MTDGQGPEDPNRHIREYLSYYLKLPRSPQYAVLLNGPWGIGKTYFVKSLLAEFEAGDHTPGYVYVSLYGLNTVAEIDSALLQALYPILKNRAVTLTAQALKAAMKFKGVETDIGIGDVLSKDVDRIYVFDDLERSGLPTDQALGYINEFVEHMGRKVIIIANENEIRGDGYRTKREKLIGKTLRVQSSFEPALTYFLSEISDGDIRQTLENHRTEIAYVFHASELDNLRILQQTLWDFERLLGCLPIEMRENKVGMSALTSLFFSLSFEIKAGRIGPDDVARRSSKLSYYGWFEKDEEDTYPIVVASRRYKEINIADPMLSDELLGNILVDGLIDRESLETAVRQSSYFVESSEEPAWRTVWYGWERTEEEFSAAVARLNEQFERREITEIGEILHMFGLRLWLAEIGELAETSDAILVEGKSYVDDLYRLGQLSPRPNDENDDDDRYGAWGGLQIRGTDKPGYGELRSYLMERRTQAALDRFPDQAKALLAEMKEDADLFHRRINTVSTDESIYARVPILGSIDPAEFVAALLSLHPHNQGQVLRALNARYEHGELDRRFPSEKPWLIDMADKLSVEIQSSSPITRERLSASIKALKKNALGEPSGDAGELEP